MAEYTKGQKVTLYNAPLYINSTSRLRQSWKTGTFYIWDDNVSNDRIRVCSSEDYVGKAGLVTGWVNISSLDVEIPATTSTARIKFTAGQKVTLSGTKVYATSVTDTVSAVKTGGYYIWSATQAQNRIRITNNINYVGVRNQVTGWVSIFEISTS